MIVYMLFAQRVGSYEGEHAPEVILAVDEYSLNDNLSLDDIAEEAIKDWEENHGEFKETFLAHNWIEVRLGQVEQTIRDLLLKPPVLQGNVNLPMPSSGNHPSYQGIKVQEGRTPGKVVDDEILD